MALGVVVIFFNFFFFLWDWGLNSGLSTCKAGALLEVLSIPPALDRYFGDGVLELFAYGGLEP
jgi:hypothetical protein